MPLPAGAEVLKQNGNAAHKAGNYTDAIAIFTQALDVLDGTESARDKCILYSNRCAARMQLHDYAAARLDAELCVQTDATWWKAHSRLGAAQYALEMYREAEASYRNALAADPSANVQAELQRCSAQVEILDRQIAQRDARDPTKQTTVQLRAKLREAYERMSLEELQEQVAEQKAYVVDDTDRAEMIEALLENRRRPKRCCCCQRRAGAYKVSPEGQKTELTKGEKALERRRVRAEKLHAMADEQLAKKCAKLPLHLRPLPDAELDKEDMIYLILRHAQEKERYRIDNYQRTLERRVIYGGVFILIALVLTIALVLFLEAAPEGDTVVA